MRILSCLAAILLICTAPAFAADESPGVTTTGTATVFVTPDKATVTIYVNTTEKDIADARSRNEAKAQKVVETIKGVGIAAADLATERMSVNEHVDEQTHKPDGYTASQSYAVTVRNLANLDKLVDAVVKTGGGSVPSVNLECSNMRQHRDQARGLAILAAQEKAKALAGALGSTIGKPRTIIEESPRNYGWGSNSNSVAEVVVPVPDTPETLPLGKIEIQATVSVTFELK